MAEGNLFTGSVPETYERALVPLIFEPYATDLAARAKGLNPNDVLETAAGTGIVTRKLAAALPQARITATDLSPHMLAVAGKAVAAPNVTFQQADAQNLPFGDDSFDLTVCQFGVMFFPDRIGAYREVRRVLRSAGTFLFNAWDRIATSPLAELAEREVNRIYADRPVHFMSRTPHGYHDPARIEADLRAAGFDMVKIESVERMAKAANAGDAARAYALGTPLAGEITERGGKPAEIGEILRLAVERDYGTGEVQAPIRALVVTAR